ncbi:hypothetical protein [Psychrobacter jeotgali]|uniref:hypothetical protein n=1 Tax=Psychrobacter jeotgali TaxID=179010 RepID=UPI0019181623|nr:hypothetical protein [Psychrobacter jeotgali]
MSSIICTYNANKTPTASHSKRVVKIIVAMIMTTLLVSTVGCNTTQGFKPTASVMVGGHKSI